MNRWSDRNAPPPMMRQSTGYFDQFAQPCQDGTRRPGIDLNDLFGLPNMDQWNNFSCPPFYEPPKPDTPPTRSIPLWFDPVWSNSPFESFGCSSGKGPSLNIQLPKLKTVIMPVITSPCHGNHGVGLHDCQGGGCGTCQGSSSKRATQAYEKFADEFMSHANDSSGANLSF